MEILAWVKTFTPNKYQIVLISAFMLSNSCLKVKTRDYYSRLRVDISECNGTDTEKLMKTITNNIKVLKNLTFLWIHNINKEMKYINEA